MEDKKKEDGPGKDEKKDGGEEKKADESGGGEEEKKKDDPPPPPPPKELIMRVYMHCEGCARKVKRSLRGFEGWLVKRKVYFFIVFSQTRD